MYRTRLVGAGGGVAHRGQGHCQAFDLSLWRKMGAEGVVGCHLDDGPHMRRHRKDERGTSRNNRPHHVGAHKPELRDLGMGNVWAGVEVVVEGGQGGTHSVP